MNLVPWPELHRARDMVDVLHNTSVEIYEDTKRSLKEGDDISARHGRGKDIMSVLGLWPEFNIRVIFIDTALVKANMAAAEQDRLPESEILAQISWVFPALLHELT